MITVLLLLIVCAQLAVCAAFRHRGRRRCTWTAEVLFPIAYAVAVQFGASR